MGLIFINVIGLFYHLMMFYGEGGFSYIISNRLVWIIGLSFAMLLQLGIISTRQLTGMIANQGNRQVNMDQDYNRPMAVYDRNLRRIQQARYYDENVYNDGTYGEENEN